MLNGKDILDYTLSEIVKGNFHTATVFEKYNLDFCCNGGRTLSDACTEKGIIPENVKKEIESFMSDRPNGAANPDNWEIDFLISYIINTHHSYVGKMLPVISAHTQKIAAVHGNNHPETIRIAEIFSEVNSEMRHHMMKEERILFPHIDLLYKSSRNGDMKDRPYFGTIKNPIAMMEHEHQSAGDGLLEIRELTDNYALPEDACETYRITFKELREFEEDLHKHVHLENNILFPRAIKMEEDLSFNFKMNS